MGPVEEKPDVFRKEYKKLSDEQKSQVIDIKLQAEQLLQIMDQAVPSQERSERSRCMNIARTNLEQVVMWAVKGVTTKQG